MKQLGSSEKETWTRIEVRARWNSLASYATRLLECFDDNLTPRTRRAPHARFHGHRDEREAVVAGAAEEEVRWPSYSVERHSPFWSAA